MPENSTEKAMRHPLARSRLSNDPWAMPGIDGRTTAGRRFRDVAVSIAGDLGGLDALSQAQVQLVKRAAWLASLCERLEGEAAAGGDFDADAYHAATDRLLRVLTRLGVERRAKDVTDLATYIAREG